jgi:hypothetical protein
MPWKKRIRGRFKNVLEPPFSLREKRKDEVLRKKLLCNFFARMEKKEVYLMALIITFLFCRK